MTKKILAFLMLIGIIGSVAGCNTMEGAGKDLQRGGAAIQDRANR